MFTLLQVVRRKSDGVRMHVCGFADRANLPKKGDQFRHVVGDFDTGIPPEFDEAFWGKAPSQDSVFCNWHEENENHPLRVEQKQRGADHGGHVHGWFEPNEIEAA